MYGTAGAKNTFAPLILRLALGGIFIYHGLDKIVGPDKGAGAGWATHAWQEQERAPGALMDKFDRAAQTDPKHEAEIRSVQEKIKAQYSADAPTLPGSLRASIAQLAVAWGELLGGIAILVGILTRLAALCEIVIQIGAIYTVTYGHGFFAQGGGYEYNVALVAMCLALAILGAGPLAIERLRRGRAHQPVSAPAHV